MRFTVSSTDLIQGLSAVSKVIAPKPASSILENFLFDLGGNSLTVTASDSETTLRSVIAMNNIDEEGRIAVPAKLLTDALRELPTQPIEFSTIEGKNIVTITWESGSAQIPYQPAEDYPEMPVLDNDFTTIQMTGRALFNGISNTVYATSDDYLRPAMNGIYFDISTESVNMVASNAHVLVCYERSDVHGESPISFSLPKKSAYIIKSILNKDDDDMVEISFNSTIAYFKSRNSIVATKLIEGKFPNYKVVMPTNNTNILTANRVDLFNASKRVAVCSNQATSQIILKISENNIMLSAQDPDFSTSAHETMSCEYSGEAMEIGVKANFFINILSNLPYEQINIKLKDATKPILILPVEREEENEMISVLLMPMIINY